MGRGHPAGEGEPESQRRRPQSSPALLRGGGVGVDAADGARRRATPERTGDLSGGSRLRRSARGAGSRAVVAVALRLDPCRRRGERGDGCFDERARQRRRAAMGAPGHVVVPCRLQPRRRRRRHPWRMARRVRDRPWPLGPLPHRPRHHRALRQPPVGQRRVARQRLPRPTRTKLASAGRPGAAVDDDGRRRRRLERRPI